MCIRDSNYHRLFTDNAGRLWQTHVMTAAHPSDPTAPSYADLLAQNAQLQQQLDAQKQYYEQQAAQLKQQYQAELAR